MTILKTVNFGSRKTGIATVGYTLINADGTTKQSRTISGVAEQGSTGIYRCDITFEDDWRGYILWDTGEATPLYATEDFDYRQSGGGTGYAGIVVDNIWTREEKEDLSIKINKIFSAIEGITKENKNTQEQLINILYLIRDINFRKETKDIIDKISLLQINFDAVISSINSIPAPNLGPIIKAVKETQANIKECIVKISETKEVNLAPLKESLNALEKQIDFSIKISTKLIKTEDLEILLKEGGTDVSKLFAKGISGQNREKVKRV
jgi:hypothetical protein